MINQMSTTQKLYHFTSSFEAILDIIQNKRLRLSNLERLNDPKESKPWPFKIIDNQNPFSFRNISKDLFYQLDEEVKRNWYVTCFKAESNDAPINDKNSPKHAYFDQKMWSHYAANGKGFCVIFDYRKLVQQLTHSSLSIFLGEINYLDEYRFGQIDPFELSYTSLVNEGLSKVINRHVELFHKELLFTKSCFWRDEQEFRIIVNKSQNEEKYVYIDIGDCIEGVILGYDSCREVQNKLMEMFENEIPIYRIFSNHWVDILIKIEKESAIVLDGISFSTLTPTYYFVMKAQDLNGNLRLIHVNNDGEVVVLE